MSLGKRPRPAMKRTTSMSLFGPSVIGSDAGPDPNPRERQRLAVGAPAKKPWSLEAAAVEAAEFLRACGICKRSLGPGKDTFIYRGDAAFCSLECREKQIKLDALKEKLSRLSRKSDALPPKVEPRKASDSSEPVVAA